jgi:hypothetical protein
MTTVSEVQDLGAELHTLRPDWDLIPILNYLAPWRHLPVDELRTLTTAWVTNPGNRTPASLKYMPGVPPKTAGGDDASPINQEPTCHICGHRRATCDRLRQRDEKYNLDPHEFMTRNQAEANRAANRLRHLEPPRGLHRSINPETVPLEPVPPPPDPETRKCHGCGGTLARGEDNHHPGCVPVDA